MFQEGDRVAWTSQANGSAIEKKGVVVEVVYSTNRPDRKRFPSLYRYNGVGGARLSAMSSRWAISSTARAASLGHRFQMARAGAIPMSPVAEMPMAISCDMPWSAS